MPILYQSLACTLALGFVAALDVSFMQEICVSDCAVKLTVDNSSLFRNSTNGTLPCDYVRPWSACENRTLMFTDDETSPYEETPYCTEGSMVLTVVQSVHHHPPFGVYVALNIKLDVTDRSTQAAALRMSCLLRGNGAVDVLCEDTRRRSCFLFDISPAVSQLNEFPDMLNVIQFPLHFEDACSRLGDYGLYSLNVTLYPQNCMTSVIVKVPAPNNVDATAADKWLPTVSVDLSLSSGIIIHVTQPPASARVRRLYVELYEIIGSKPDHHLTRNDELIPPNSTVFFGNIRRGRYSLYVYAKHQYCPEEGCASMKLPFYLAEDRYSQAQLDDIANKQNAWIPAIVAFAIVLFILCWVLVAVMVYLRWQNKKRKRQQREVNVLHFTSRPHVLILYTDDFPRHRRCVLELASYLRDRGNCEVELDEWALRSNSRISPADWLLQAFQRANYYILIFSAGTKATVLGDTSSGQELRPERPFDELFPSAMSLVLNGMLQTTATNNNSSDVERYVCIRFAYSSPDCVPELFDRLACTTFALPPNADRLICHLHGLPHESLRENESEMTSLTSAIDEATEFVADNPDWLASRLQARTSNVDSLVTATMGNVPQFQRQTLPENLSQLYSTVLEKKMAENALDEEDFPLLPPVVEDENSAGEQFELLPPDDPDLNRLYMASASSGFVTK